MIPISLTLEGFLSYKEPVEIDFTGFDLACISGENGAGKSSLLDAITWALFGRARKHDESVINLDSDRARVSLVFAYEGNQYRVVRTNPRGDTKEAALSIRSDSGADGAGSWNSLTERTLRETDQRISEILRLDYETFVNASFFLQGEADQFTQQTPAARKKILSQILGLEIWESYRKRAFENRRAVENQLSQLEGRIEEITAELDREEERNQQLRSLEQDLAAASKDREDAESALQDLKLTLTSLEDQAKLVEGQAAKLAESKAKLARTEKKLDLRLQEQAGYRDILEQAADVQRDHQAWESARQSLASWEATAEKFRESEIKRQDPLLQIAAEKARLLQEQTSLQDQEKELKSELAGIPQLEADLKIRQEEADRAQEGIIRRDQKKQELEDARQGQADARAENPRLYQEMQDLKDRIRELEETEGAACPLCGQELAPEDRSGLIEELKNEGKELGDRYRENQALLKKVDGTVKDLQLEITELSQQENKLRTARAEIDKIHNQLAALEKKEQDWEANLRPRLAAIQKSLEEETYAEEARGELKKVNAELKAIGYDAAEHDRVRDLVSRGGAIQEKKAILDKAEAALGPLDREITELQGGLEADSRALEAEAEQLEQARQRLDASRANAPDTRLAEEELFNLREKENILQREVGAAQQKVAVLAGQRERLKELQTQREAIMQRVRGYRQLEEAFGKDGVPALLIEQALPNIESKANQILEKLTGGNMTVRFITQRDYKSASREDKKETLEIQIRDQNGVRDYEMFSGGESFRINFAVRLALSHILTQRAGARLQTLVIDEGFGSQDALGRQRLIEAINLIEPDFQKILVITHVEEIKEAFSTQLLVEKTPRGSQVTLV